MKFNFSCSGGMSYLVVVDSFSKWIEVVPENIGCVMISFVRYGLPKEKNWCQTMFVSAAFEKCMQQNGIRHSKTPPYHPAANGAAEGSPNFL